MARRTDKTKVSTWLPDFVGVVVTAVWASSYVAEILKPDFDTPEGVTEVMMILVGFLFSVRQIISARAEKNSKELESKDSEPTDEDE